MAVAWRALLALALPGVCYGLRNFGPAGRVVFFDYLPIVPVVGYGFALLLGLNFGARVSRWSTASTRGSRARILTPAHSVGLMLLAVWCIWPTLQAFPAHGDMAARDRWAREHVRYYGALTRVIAAIPQVQADLGGVTTVAPTADADHRYAVEMNGDDMIFALDVSGPRGRGVFHANCTLDDEHVFDWQPGSWRYAGHEVRIDAVPPLVPR